MQLDKFTDYALRILMTLAAQPDVRVPTSQIAKVFDLSENHLSKVATTLVRHGFIMSERGRGGGLSLARKSEDINVGAVVRRLKENDPVVECFGVNKSCLILPACGLRNPLAKAKEAFFSVLDHYTLADITSQRTMLADLTAFATKDAS